MERKEGFKIWLSNISKVSKSASKYAGAISTISKELTKHLGEDIDIYQIQNPLEIDSIENKYLSIDELRKKNKRGKVMYTKALYWYKIYLEEGIYNNSVKDISNNYSIVYKKKDKGEFVISDGNKQWKRDRSVVDRSIELSDNKCEYDNKHEYFISNKSRKNYVEGHHLIPMKYQEQFEYSLDVEANVVSLCVVCHKILHLGTMEDKIKIIDKLYKLRKELLHISGLEISLDELVELYK